MYENCFEEFEKYSNAFISMLKLFKIKEIFDVNNNNKSRKII